MKAICNNYEIKPIRFKKPFHPSTHCMLADGTFGTKKALPNIESVSVDDFSLLNVLKLPYVESLKQAQISANFDSASSYLEAAAESLQNEIIVPENEVETLKEE